MDIKASAENFDVIVVGAGLGGIYALHVFAGMGLKVVCLEQSNQLGGVWNLNRYPGARVDVPSVLYSYHFSDDLYREWVWKERYPTQGDLLEYLNHVADRLDVRRLMKFDSCVVEALWLPEKQHYEVVTSDGTRRTGRFLVMATGNLTEPRDPNIPGIENFQGQVLTTSRWPQTPVDLAGKRIGVFGTGSSNVQAIPELAKDAGHLYVYQRSAHYAVPAWNQEYQVDQSERAGAERLDRRKKLFEAIGKMQAGANLNPDLGPSRPAADYTKEEQRQRFEAFWRDGGQNLLFVFADQSYDEGSAEIVSDFLRDKIRQVVEDPIVAEKLCPKYPVGLKRIANETGYYETYNRDNVTLVDIAESPIVEVTAKGIRTTTSFQELDIIVLGLGFKAFVGAIDKAGIRNELGNSPTSSWSRGPRTMLGLMTDGFPNLFILTGPGSPSVAGDLFKLNEVHVEWVADCIKFMTEHGYTSIVPTHEAVTRWTDHVTELGRRSIRSRYPNYMLHINYDDGSSVTIPYRGPMGRYFKELADAADEGYREFEFI